MRRYRFELVSEKKKYEKREQNEYVVLFIYQAAALAKSHPRKSLHHIKSFHFKKRHKLFARAP